MGIAMPTGLCPCCCGDIPCRAPGVTTVAEIAICAGQDLVLAPVYTGTGPLTYLWEYDSGGGWAPVPGGTTPTITVAPDADTVYRVTVANPCGGAQGETTVTVNTAPEIVTQPEGGDAPIMLTVVATGAPPLTYQWQAWDGSAWQDIPGETSPEYQADPDETTDYRVIVSNPCGEATSETATVTVPPEQLLVEISRDGGETWQPAEPGDTYNGGNLFAADPARLLLRLTSPVDTAVTVASDVPQVLDPPAGPIALTAGAPEVVTLLPRDPGRCTLTVTPDALPVWTQTATCYVLPGVIRTFGNGGTVPGSLTIARAPIDPADVAAATGHADPEAAYVASATNDWIVGVQAAEFSSHLGYITHNIRLCSDDSVAPTGGRYGDGCRIKAPGDPTVRATGNNVVLFVHDIGLAVDLAGTAVVSCTGNNCLLFVERCRIRKTSTGAAVGLGGSGSQGTLANCYVECGMNTNQGAITSSGDGSLRVLNCTIAAIATAGVGVDGSSGSSRPECGGTLCAPSSAGVFAFGDWGTVLPLPAAGFNGSSDSTAPGSTPYHGLALGDYVADPTTATLDLAVADRATLEAHPCADNSAYSARDVDCSVRDFWGLGAKWVPA